MKAFVTGSTGLLGSNLVEALLHQGWQVKALVRSAEKAAAVLPRHERLEWVTGDMEQVAALAPYMQGCDILFHTAAYFREYFGRGDHWAHLEKINVRGTIHLLEQAEQVGIQKVIYVSSGGVIGQRSDGHPADETTPPDAKAAYNLYFKSKVVAEEAIASFLQTHHLPVILILPAAIFGPRDAAPTAAGKLVQDFLKGRLPAVPPGGFTVVDVRDVAQAMIAAVTRGQSGERYIIGDRYQSIAQILTQLHQLTGAPLPRLHLSYPLALVVAFISEVQARLLNQDPDISINAIRTLNGGFGVTSAKAMRELGVTYRPFEETLRAMVQWYVDQGSVPAGLMPPLARSSA